MNRLVFNKIIETLFTSNKSEYVLKCTSRDFDFKIHINDVIKVETISKGNEPISFEKIYSSAEGMVLPKMNPVSITETRYTPSGQLSYVHKEMIYKEAELLLFVFKVLKQNVQFVLQNKETTRVCYFINSRSMYVKSTDKVNELVDTNIYRLYGSMKNAEVVLISSLPKRFSCGDFYIKQNEIAKKYNKEFRDIKDGVGVR